MSNLLEICWQHLMSWLKNKQSNLQSFKTNTVLNRDVCWLLFHSLSSGQLWQQNALKNIQPVLEKDQKQIRCQHQLASVLQKRGKNKVRWGFLAMHHFTFPIFPQELLGTAQHLCQGPWTCDISGILLSTTAPPPSPKEPITLYSDSTRTFLLEKEAEGKEAWALVWLDMEQR